jgi:hypothetical protein
MGPLLQNGLQRDTRMTAFSRNTFGIVCIAVAAAVSVASPMQQQTVITINPSVNHQLMQGWEVIAEANEHSTIFDQFGPGAIQMTADMGINRIRLPLKSGTENTVDSWTNWKNAGFPPLLVNNPVAEAVWRAKRYETINDNADPNVANLASFKFSELDDRIDKVVNPLRARLQAKGESLYVNLNYVSFYNQVTSGAPNVHLNAAEYAEFILTAFQHIQSKYGWTPNALEIMLEPDNVPFWGGTYVGQAIAAVGARLAAAGFTPDIIAPSTTRMDNASAWFDQMAAVPGALTYLKELSYHRYGGVSAQALQNIVNRAQQNSLRTSMLEHWAEGFNNFLTLHEDVKVGRNSAWEQSTLVARDDPTGLGISYFTTANPTVHTPSAPTKFTQQYFRYVRTGARRKDATSNSSNFDPLAFQNTDGKYTVIVKANSAGSLSIQGLPAGTYGVYHTTSASANPNDPNPAYAVSNPDQTITQGQALSTSIPAYGVLTVYAKGGTSRAPTVPTNLRIIRQ